MVKSDSMLLYDDALRVTNKCILICSMCLQNNAKLMLPWMVMVGVLLLLDASSIIMNILLAGFRAETITTLMIWVVVSVVMVRVKCDKVIVAGILFL